MTLSEKPWRDSLGWSGDVGIKTRRQVQEWIPACNTSIQLTE